MLRASSNMRRIISTSSLPGSVSPQQALAPADEQFNPEFVLQILDVLADPDCTRWNQRAYFSQIELAANGLLDNAKLLEIQIFSP